MQIQIKYKSGKARKINLHPYFFASNDVARKLPGYDESVSDRASKLAYSTGKDPYYICVIRDGVMVHEQTIQSNKPDLFTSTYKIDEKQIKKDLRRETKKQPLRKFSFTEINSFD